MIRHARPTDAAELSKLVTRAYSEIFPHPRFDSAAYTERLNRCAAEVLAVFLSDPDTRGWIAEAGGSILGFSALRIHADEPSKAYTAGAELAGLYVLDPERRRGLGRSLLAEAEAEAERHGRSYLWFDSSDTASDALRTYLHWGFEPIDARVYRRSLFAGAQLLALARA